jgi:nucleotide-binding universal stress UspA family protein
MPRTGHGCLTKTSPPEGADSYELGYFNALRTGIPVAPLTTRQRVRQEARSMYERMLVPLDGSEVAEAILPFAEQIAGPLDAEVVLLRVIEPPSPIELVASTGVVAPDTFTVRDVEAKAYLSEVQRRLSKKGLRVRTRVALGGPPAEEILAAAQATSTDLIAMATRGRSGLGRALFGSVAESVLRASPVPVLLIRTPIKSKAAPEPGTR